MPEIAEEQGTGQQNWVTQHKDWKRGNTDVTLGCLLSVSFHGTCSFSSGRKAIRKQEKPGQQ